MSDSFNTTQDKQSYIRNFAIIAHIDHGKSTLADRLMEITGTVQKRDMQAQLLDSNPIERERGITIKLAPVRMVFRCHPGRRAGIQGEAQWIPGQARNDTKDDYILNLIDTPGHVDFSYEVSRSLAACEGAILLVDATQGVQAQTLSHLAKARKQKLTIIPVINKIDLPNARVEETARELEALGFPPISPNTPISPILISAKTGQGVEELLEAIVDRVPEPHGEPAEPLRALVFSSQYDSHKGVVVFVRIVDGSFTRSLLAKQGDSLRLRFLASGAEATPIEIGYFIPKMTPCDILRTGEVGYIATGLKDARLAKVGDTISMIDDRRSKVDFEVGKWNVENPTSTIQHQDPASTLHRPPSIVPLPGYHDPQPMVFLGLFPVSAEDVTPSREAMERLRLSDAAFTFKPIHSAALGNGFHCGFLGLLHAEIVQERLRREFGITMIATSPSVEYHISFARGGLAKLIQSAAEFPDPSGIKEIREPVMQVTIYSPKNYVGSIMQLAQEKRGELVDLSYQGDQAKFLYRMPLSEIIIDFFDRLKGTTEGYASLDYELSNYQLVKLIKVDILVNKEKVDALSFLVTEDAAARRARQIVERLGEAIPRQQFEVPVQAAIGGQIIARADIKSFRKDVTQKLYGGDRSRKDKLLDKQKKGKARMKMVGKIAIPQEAFFSALRQDK